MKCLSCLKKFQKYKNEEGYCPDCVKKLFDGVKISHILPFDKPYYDKARREMQTKISISGVQTKILLKIENSELIPSPIGSAYILKPSISEYERQKDSSANEHVTMQIAHQIYKFDTAQNALIRFGDGEFAYITRRFDINADGSKIPQEDFCQLMEKSEENGGKHYKYEGSYLDAAKVFEKFTKIPYILSERYFQIILFNYIFNNGDAHFKNFSLYLKNGRYTLSPFYDLMNTRLHISDESLALKGGLYLDDMDDKAYMANGFYSARQFIIFAEKLGIKKQQAQKFIADMTAKTQPALEMIENSFLSEEGKKYYIKCVENASRAINNTLYCE